jgi:hypothetical protein
MESVAASMVSVCEAIAAELGAILNEEGTRAKTIVKINLFEKPVFDNIDPFVEFNLI